MKYEVGYISGNSLKFLVVTEEAGTKEDAVKQVFDREGANFENRLAYVKEVPGDEETDDSVISCQNADVECSGHCYSCAYR